MMVVGDIRFAKGGDYSPSWASMFLSRALMLSPSEFVVLACITTPVPFDPMVNFDKLPVACALSVF